MIPLFTLDPEKWTDFKVCRIEGETKHWRIGHFTIEQNDIERMRLFAEGRDPGFGEFTALYYRTDHPSYVTSEPIGQEWRPMMSDTCAEITDHLVFMDRVATAVQWQPEPVEVLIGGLGLGMVVEACALMGANVTVIESDPEVISLMAHQVPKDVRVVQADVFRWVPDRQYDFAWWDIWAAITPGNLSQMRRLKHRYRKYVTGWQGCWAWEHCLYMKRVERTDPFEVIRDRLRVTRLLGEEAAQDNEERKWLMNWVGKVNALKAKGEDDKAEELTSQMAVEFKIDQQERARRKKLRERMAELRERAASVRD